MAPETAVTGRRTERRALGAAAAVGAVCLLRLVGFASVGFPPAVARALAPLLPSAPPALRPPNGDGERDRDRERVTGPRGSVCLSVAKLIRIVRGCQLNPRSALILTSRGVSCEGGCVGPRRSSSGACRQRSSVHKNLLTRRETGPQAQPPHCAAARPPTDRRRWSRGSPDFVPLTAVLGA